MIKNCNTSVSVHIRRGDYINSIHDVLNNDYFIHCINYMQKQLVPEQPTFFIFSTDTEWIKDKILPKLPKEIKYHIFSNNKNSDGIKDFYLMSTCNHQICSNSSFSYYSAFLNKNTNKNVILPEKWMKDEEPCPLMLKGHATSMRFPNWTVMSNNGRIIN